jgi:hypothetical protein
MSGRAPDDLIEEALEGYLGSMAQIRETLDSRYDDVTNGRVDLIDGEVFFESLRKRGEELRKLRGEK